MERGWDSVVAPRTKRGDQEVWRGAGTQWSRLDQRGVARRCGEKLRLTGNAYTGQAGSTIMLCNVAFLLLISKVCMTIRNPFIK